MAFQLALLVGVLQVVWCGEGSRMGSLHGAHQLLPQRRSVAYLLVALPLYESKLHSSRPVGLINLPVRQALKADTLYGNTCWGAVCARFFQWRLSVSTQSTIKHASASLRSRPQLSCGRDSHVASLAVAATCQSAVSLARSLHVHLLLNKKK